MICGDSCEKSRASEWANEQAKQPGSSSKKKLGGPPTTYFTDFTRFLGNHIICSRARCCTVVPLYREESRGVFFMHTFLGKLLLSQTFTSLYINIAQWDQSYSTMNLYRTKDIFDIDIFLALLEMFWLLFLTWYRLWSLCASFLLTVCYFCQHMRGLIL